MSLTPAEAAAEVLATIDDPDFGTDFSITTPTADMNGSGVELTAEQGTPATVRGILEPLSYDAAVRAFGMDAIEPKRIFVKGSDAVKLALGGRVSGGNLRKPFYVVSPPRPLDLGEAPVTIVCEALLDIQPRGTG